MSFFLHMKIQTMRYIRIKLLYRVGELKSVEINNELAQNVSVLQIYPSFVQNSESETFAERSKRTSRKVDFNVVRDPNIPLGFVNYGENVYFFICHAGYIFFT